MEFTNDLNLPDFVHKGLTYNNYNRDGIRFDISATKLIDSPQIAQMWKEHGRDVVEDSSNRVWAAFGTAAHSVFEDANKANADIIMEKRYVHEIEGKLVAAQIDAYEISSRTLYDIKTCGSFKIVKGDFTQWENQLNVCAALMRRSGYEVDAVKIVAVVKDWSKMKSDKDAKYPTAPVSVVNIPLWNPEVAEEYIKSRLEAHFGEGEKLCSDSERWKRPGSFAVMRKGRKSAKRLLNSAEEAEEWIGKNGEVEDYVVERPSIYTRCESYCAFKSFCKQYQQLSDKAI